MKLHELFESKIAQTDTPAFKAWFRDSKVVDSAGNPMIVYHGTAKKFRAFNIKKSVQPIIWFTSNRESIEKGEVGAAGSGHIFELYASIQNPAGWDKYDKLGLGELQREGFDGAILPNGDGTFDGFVFAPNQLKAVDNRGMFDPNTKNLRG